MPSHGPVSSSPVSTTNTQVVEVDGIGSTSAVGSPQVIQVVQPSGIASVALVGQPKSTYVVKPNGIASISAVGSPGVRIRRRAYVVS